MHTYFHSKGFTLIETFVAITVLSLAVAGPLTIAWRGLQTTLVSRDQLIATYLAQEAIEFIRYKRDNNVLAGRSWLGDIPECLNGNECQINIETPSANDQVTACGGGGCDNLYLDEGTGVYSFDPAGTETSFVRTVQVQDGDNSFEKVVHVRVDWRSGSQERSIEVSDRIFDWASGLIVPQ